ncbi:efflux RND transporter periplasmic adaptor subunit [uncultured Desulfuromonas sp.]|uniref:efflux RND transporter periplasmic adaptor subunit n=1 Tax=uncultured Desulfuromonas sp. TaxID=181013 RepID=UPI002AAB97F8|nr:efflux RND transporter periplasmic adaptor subunit [uncultured Desulfuromonas sp.]
MDNMPDHHAASTPTPRKRVWLRVLIIVVILAASFFAASYLIKTAPKAAKKAKVKKPVLVSVMPAKPQAHQVTITAAGQVVASRKVDLQAQVSGQVIRLNDNFDLGKRLAKGQELLALDPVDYEVALAEQQAALADARYALSIEEGLQEVARREWQLFEQEHSGQTNLPPALALREPHLKKAEAKVRAAEAGVDKARIDLQRTIITTPFDALVIDKAVDLGSQLSSQSTVATLVATDEFWVELSVPMQALAWIEIPDYNATQGSHVKISTAAGNRTGTILRLLADLETQGRMARLLVRISDPLDLGHPVAQRTPLLLGDYVEVTILGRTLAEATKVPRQIIHDNRHLWLAKDKKLHIRPVEIAWRDKEYFYLTSGVSAGELIVTSDLAAPVEGLSLRLDRPKAQTSGDEAGR